jgi:hypothetical protein
MGQGREIVIILGRIGDVLVKHDEPEGALRCLGEAHDLLEGGTDIRARADLVCSIAQCHPALGDQETARRYSWRRPRRPVRPAITPT